MATIPLSICMNLTTLGTSSMKSHTVLGFLWWLIEAAIKCMDEISPEALETKSGDALSVGGEVDRGIAKDTQNSGTSLHSCPRGVTWDTHGSASLSWLPQMEVWKAKWAPSYKKHVGLLGSVLTAQKCSYETSGILWSWGPFCLFPDSHL